MRQRLLLFAILALAFTPARHAPAEGGVSLDFFYTNLNGGNWIEVAGYGYCWQPGVAVGNPEWRPYADGFWVYSDVGWTWVSNEDFGWATYHYGRWAHLADYGWVWVPGTDWGPAWVSWRTGGDYVGWAPLPPGRSYHYGSVASERRPRAITGAVDVDYDIGPLYYNFVDVRYIGEPVLRERIFDPAQNVVYIGETVNVTNITWRNGAYYDYGPDYNRLSAYSTHPIQRLTLERQLNVDPATALQNGTFTRVNGDRLVVAAPQKIAIAPTSAAPKEVKAKIDKPQLETGWSGVSDPNVKTQLQQKFRTENRNSIPPPKFEPTNPALLKRGEKKKEATHLPNEPLTSKRQTGKAVHEKHAGMHRQQIQTTPHGHGARAIHQPNPAAHAPIGGAPKGPPKGPPKAKTQGPAKGHAKPEKEKKGGD